MIWKKFFESTNKALVLMDKDLNNGSIKQYTLSGQYTSESLKVICRLVSLILLKNFS